MITDDYRNMLVGDLGRSAGVFAGVDLARTTRDEIVAHIDRTHRRAVAVRALLVTLLGVLVAAHLLAGVWMLSTVLRGADAATGDAVVIATVAVPALAAVATVVFTVALRVHAVVTATRRYRSIPIR